MTLVEKTLEDNPLPCFDVSPFQFPKLLNALAMVLNQDQDKDKQIDSSVNSEVGDDSSSRWWDNRVIKDGPLAEEQKWVLTNLQNSPIHSHFVGTVQTSVFRLGSQARVIFERW